MTTIVLFIAGLVLLIAGAEVLVRGATRLAVSLGIPPLIVGLTVVAYATGSPELAVAVQSARTDQTQIAMGNIVGSNIFNILFILGISAAILPLAVSRRLVRAEVPLMIGVSGLLFLMARSGSIGRLEGIALIACSVIYTTFVVIQSRREIMLATPKQVRENEEFAEERAGGTGRVWIASLALIAIGLGMLVLGADWLVDGAITFAKHLGISETVIALTIVAAGTGLPEVATSVIAGLRGEREIAVGNVVGSNIFNILAVVGVGAIAAPAGMTVPPQMLSFDILIMIGAAVACLPILFTGYEMARWEGFLFLGYYVAYTTFLVLKATSHPALPMYSMAMLVFVLPLTVITVAVLGTRPLLRKRAPAATE